MTWTLDNLSLRNFVNFFELSFSSQSRVDVSYFFYIVIFLLLCARCSPPRLVSSRHCLVCVYLIFIDLQPRRFASDCFSFLLDESE